MRDSGGNEGEDGEEDEDDACEVGGVGNVGSGDGPSMRSMYPGNDNQPVVALHAEIAVYCHRRVRKYGMGLPA
jgi:hypothetical protein